MAEYNLSNVQTAGLETGVKDVTIDSEHPESEGPGKGITYFYYSDADDNLGYYLEMPEINSSLRVLANRVVGLGYTAELSRDRVVLENMKGIGGESFKQIMENFLISKKIFGMAIAEIIKNNEDEVINIKNLYAGDIAVGVDEKGMIDHFLQINKQDPSKNRKLQLNQVMFSMNGRIANGVKGISIIRPLKKIIDAKNEALSDERKIRHREGMAVLEVDTEDSTEIATAIGEYQKAVNKKDVFVTMKGVSEFKDPPSSPRDRIQYMQYLDSYFYQVVGTPKILVTSEGFTEAGGKAGLIAFEPTEITDKKELEDTLWNQAAIKIIYTRTPSLLGQEQRTQQQNSGQTSIQPNETKVNSTRTE